MTKYSPGGRVFAAEADALISAANTKADRVALQEEILRLKDQVFTLKHQLSRARRCLASERHGREQLRLRLQKAESSYDFSVGILCRLAFPKEYA